MDATRQRFIEGLPKAELHLHIEGTLEPELMFELAERNSIKLNYKSVDALREAYSFGNLQEFLDLYYQGAGVLITERDFYDLTMAYLRKVHAENVKHVEIFFDPQTHTARGIAFATVIDGITRALDEAQRTLGMSSYLIMSFLRHLTEAEAFDTLAEAAPYRDRIIGVGLDSSEVGNPPSKFKNVFIKARNEGYLLMAHAGEEGPVEYIIEALDILQVDRIDHGNRCTDDANLMAELARRGIALTLCPLSNEKLQVCPDLSMHPARRLLKAGVRATIHSDDPAYFGGYMNANYLALADALQLDLEEIAQLARNAFEASFLPNDRKEALLYDLVDYGKNFG